MFFSVLHFFVILGITILEILSLLSKNIMVFMPHACILENGCIVTQVGGERCCKVISKNFHMYMCADSKC